MILDYTEELDGLELWEVTHFEMTLEELAGELLWLKR